MNITNQEGNTGYLLYHLTMILQRKMKRELDKLDITHTQFIVIATLYKLTKNSEAVTQIDIANESKTDRMMVSKILRTLQEKGYVTRQEHLTDTRAKTISLTDNGRIVFQKAFIIVQQVGQDFFKCLNEQTKPFNDILKIIISHNQ